MRKHIAAIGVLAGVIGTMSVSGQCFVDIGLAYATPSELEIRLRPSADFDTLFSSLVFTVRWQASSGAHLGSISQSTIVNDYMHVTKSGAEQDSAGYRYQIFSGLGFSWISDAGTAWVGGQEYVLLTVPITGGGSSFEIVNDDWTHPALHNGDYYVSLNGATRTGIIYAISTGVPDAPADELILGPDPTRGATDLVFTPGGSGDVEMRVINSAGQEVWQRTRRNVNGTLHEIIDLSAAGKGVYLLSLTTAQGAVLTRRIVVQ